MTTDTIQFRGSDQDLATRRDQLVEVEETVAGGSRSESRIRFPKANGHCAEPALMDHPMALQYGGGGKESPVALAMACAREAMDELVEGGCLSGEMQDDLMAEYETLVKSQGEHEPVPEVLVFLARRKVGPDCEEGVFSEADRLVNVLLRSGRRRKAVRCPFLHLTRMPAIYREIPEVLEFCRVLMTPVIQAHEKELITLATINPVTGVRAMEIVAQIVEDASGRRPIPAMAVALAAHWAELNHKHFGL